MPTRKTTPTGSIYQLKVTLKDARPPIWRRIQVIDDTTLAKLHRILQIVMGWSDYHLHDFTIYGARYSEPSPDDWEPVKDERRYKLKQLVPGEKSKFVYQYDFGDSWDHEILVEKTGLPREPGVKYPRCLTGKRACPPEDVGGVWGYREFLEAMRDPEHPEHDGYLEWAGSEFDPETFDLEEVNRALRSVK